MKLKMLIPIAAIAVLMSCGPSYKVTDDGVVVVPEGTRTAFVTQYPTATGIVWSAYDPAITPIVDWELAGWPVMDGSDYVVQFNMDGQPYYAWYDSDGNWVGTAYVMNTSVTLPTSVQTTLNNQFSGYTVTKVNREFANGRDAFEIELKSGDSKTKLLVDMNGNIIKQKTKVQ